MQTCQLGLCLFPLWFYFFYFDIFEVALDLINYFAYITNDAWCHKKIPFYHPDSCCFIFLNCVWDGAEVKIRPREDNAKKEFFKNINEKYFKVKNDYKIKM